MKINDLVQIENYYGTSNFCRVLYLIAIDKSSFSRRFIKIEFCRCARIEEDKENEL